MDIFVLASILFLFSIGFWIVILIVGVYTIVKINEINTRTLKIDRTLDNVSTNMQLGQMENVVDEVMKEHQKMTKRTNSKAIFRTADGKYVAGSLKELFEKISTDPNSNINQHELEALKKFFEQISSEIENNEEEDDEDE